MGSKSASGGTPLAFLRSSNHPSGLDQARWHTRYSGASPQVRWQSGDAADCKSAYGGSIPPRTSSYFNGLV